jgi:hypothetical protein
VPVHPADVPLESLAGVRDTPRFDGHFRQMGPRQRCAMRLPTYRLQRNTDSALRKLVDHLGHAFTPLSAQTGSFAVA